MLTEVFTHHMPVHRYLPCHLLRHILSDLGHLLCTSNIDGASIIQWSNKCIRNVCVKRYAPATLTDGKHELLLVEYFIGHWAGREKPFCHTEVEATRRGLQHRESMSSRFTPQQPTFFGNQMSSGSSNINKRKLSELSNILIRLCQGIHCQVAFPMLLKFVSFDYDFLLGCLQTKKYAILDETVNSELVLSQTDEDEMNVHQLNLLRIVINDNMTQLVENPGSLGPVISENLLIYYNLLPEVTSLIDQIDEKGAEQCSLLPVLPCAEPCGKGSDCIKVNGHIGCIGDVCVTNNTFYSASTHIIGTRYVDSNNKITFNAQPIGIPSGDYFQLILDTPDRCSAYNIGESDDGLENMVLALKYIPILYIVSQIDGKIISIIDCRNNFPNNKWRPIKHGTLSTRTPFVAYVIFHDSPHLHIYFPESGKLIKTLQTEHNIKDFMEIDNKLVVVLETMTCITYRIDMTWELTNSASWGDKSSDSSIQISDISSFSFKQQSFNSDYEDMDISIILTIESIETFWSSYDSKVVAYASASPAAFVAGFSDGTVMLSDSIQKHYEGLIPSGSPKNMSVNIRDECGQITLQCYIGVCTKENLYVFVKDKCEQQLQLLHTIPGRFGWTYINPDMIFAEVDGIIELFTYGDEHYERLNTLAAHSEEIVRIRVIHRDGRLLYHYVLCQESG